VKQVHKNIDSVKVKRRNSFRDNFELIRKHISLLSDGRIQCILKLYIEGITLSEMATITGKSKTALHRLIHKELKRISKAQYSYVLQYRRRFTKEERAVAIDYYIQGINITKISSFRGMSLYRVRNIINCINAKTLNRG
jgi:predicted DNA-binding protein YlxM (UPF0122 family)